MSTNKIQAIQVLKPYFRKEETLALIEECLDNGWTGMGNKTLIIEEEWKKYTGLQHAHFLSSNTVGLHLALEIPKRKFGWDSSSEIITTPISFISTNHAILQAGLTPVFADVGKDLCINVDTIRPLINENTKGVVFVGIGGNMSGLSDVIDLCKAKGLWLVLDAAHMAGTYDLAGRHAGHNCDVTVFSFQAVKNLPTADSGMICFDDSESDKYCRQLSWLGINKDTFTRTNSMGSYKWDYNVDELGYKYHGNSIMAAMAIAQLPHLDADNAYRRFLYDCYQRDLEPQVSNISLIEHENCISSRHLIQIIVDKRDEFMMALNEQDIYPGVHYKDNTTYRPYQFAFGSCPNAHSISKKIISLPCHMGISANDAKRVCDAIISIQEKMG